MFLEDSISCNKQKMCRNPPLTQFSESKIGEGRKLTVLYVVQECGFRTETVLQTIDTRIYIPSCHRKIVYYIQNGVPSIMHPACFCFLKKPFRIRGKNPKCHIFAVILHSTVLEQPLKKRTSILIGLTVFREG